MTTAWKTISVFISSMFKDMQAEGDHLERFVFPKLRLKLLKWRIHLADVKLRLSSFLEPTGTIHHA